MCFDKEARKMSEEFFNDEHFPNVLIDALAEHAQKMSAPKKAPAAAVSEGKGKANKKPASTPAPSPSADDAPWGEKFLKKYSDELLELLDDGKTILSQMNEQGQSSLQQLHSPTAVVADFGYQLMNFFTLEKSLSNLAPFCFPTKYLYVLNFSDLKQNGLELVLLWMANKVLLPNKYFLIINLPSSGKDTDNLVQTILQKQLDAYSLDSKTSKSLLDSLSKVINMLPKNAIIDGCVSVLANVASSAGTDLNSSVDKENESAMKGLANTRKVVSTQSNRDAELQFSVVTDVKYTVFVVNEDGKAGSSPSKAVHIKSSDDKLPIQAPIKLNGKGGDCGLVVVLVKRSQIRIIYI